MGNVCSLKEFDKNHLFKVILFKVDNALGTQVEYFHLKNIMTKVQSTN